MRRLMLTALATGLVLALVPGARADDEIKSIVEKAIKAHGGDKLDKLKAFKLKNKGKIEIGGGATFTQEIQIQLPGKFKESMDLSIMGQNITIQTVFDGKQGWVSAAGQTMDAKDVLLTELQEAGHMINLGLTKILKEKTVELSLLGEVKVNDRPALGIKVASKGHRDVNMYFDKENGLVAKIERRTVDMTGKEVNEERIITEYQDVDGLKMAKKVSVLHDGKMFVEAEVEEVKLVDNIDDSEFAKP